MHYTGTVWRPPYEAGSLLLQATAGCTHHRCKFCTLYHELPFSFRMSPLEEIEDDLREAQMLFTSPLDRMAAALQGIHKETYPHRIFLTGGNPFVVRFERLREIAQLIHRYFPQCQTIGCFARITDITLKTDKELEQLRQLGYDAITIGVETGDGQALNFMRKGYAPEDILTQCRRMDQAGLRYHLFYLTGISGAGRGKEGAQATAHIFNQLHPISIGASMLTIYPESELYQEIQAGNWREEGELEKLEEMEELVRQLTIPVCFAALGASNMIPFQGRLPRDREELLADLQSARKNLSEEQLRHYRTHLPHL